MIAPQLHVHVDEESSIPTKTNIIKIQFDHSQAALARPARARSLKPGRARARPGLNKVALGLARVARCEVNSNTFRRSEAALNWADATSPSRLGPGDRSGLSQVISSRVEIEPV